MLTSNRLIAQVGLLLLSIVAGHASGSHDTSVTISLAGSLSSSWRIQETPTLSFQPTNSSTLQQAIGETTTANSLTFSVASQSQPAIGVTTTANSSTFFVASQSLSPGPTSMFETASFSPSVLQSNAPSASTNMALSPSFVSSESSLISKSALSSASSPTQTSGSVSTTLLISTSFTIHSSSDTLIPITTSPASIPPSTGMPSHPSTNSLPTETTTVSPQPSLTPTPSQVPTPEQQFNYKLILYTVLPISAVLLIPICIALCLCCKRYRKVRRYRLRLIPLTDADGSDSDEEDEEIHLQDPAFMVNPFGPRPALAFEDDDS